MSEMQPVVRAKRPLIFGRELGDRGKSDSQAAVLRESRRHFMLPVVSHQAFGSSVKKVESKYRKKEHSCKALPTSPCLEAQNPQSVWYLHP